METKQKYKAQWFQYSNGRYLSLDESFNSIALCYADDIETAIEIFKEKESSDSEVSFESRVNVWAVKERIFWRVKYKHSGFCHEDYSKPEYAIKRANMRIKDFPEVHEITERGNESCFSDMQLDHMIKFTNPYREIHIKDI